MNIHLFRHGQVDGPAALYGRTNVALSAQGLRSLRAATEMLQAPDLIVTSPLQRCHQYAAESSAKHGCKLQVEEGLQEMDFGRWDGVPYRADSPDWPLMTAFWQAPDQVSPPGGETLENMQKRVNKAWNALQTLPHENIWVFAHGGTIRLIIAQILQLDWRNASLYANLSIGYASRTLVHGEAQPSPGTSRVQAIAIPAPESSAST